jgi:anti-anti-sigma regulatory factor
VTEPARSSAAELRPLQVEGLAEVYEVSGHIGGEACLELSAVVEALLTRGAVAPIFECARLRALTSTGLSMVVKCADALRERGGGLTLVGVPKKVRIVLEMLGLIPSFLAVRDASLVARPPRPLRLEFRLRAAWREGAAVLRAEGLLDDRTRPEELAPLREGPPDIELECGGLRVAGARGLELIGRASTGLAHAGGSLSLFGVSAELQAAIRGEGLERVFKAVREELATPARPS